ncbi:MAG: dephospho-CoA kinase [Pseudomonadota bacterium]
MKILGLTGSIATGKSFIASIFKQHNIEVFSSDKEVSKLLNEQRVVDLLRKNKHLSEVIIGDFVDKTSLSKLVFNNDEALKELEEILYPLIKERREEFVKKNKEKQIVLFEIPLLFEKNYQHLCDKIITSFCTDKTQIERALRRKNIDEKRLEFILDKQMHSKIKATLADYIVYTDISYEYTKDQLKQIFNAEGIR